MEPTELFSCMTACRVVDIKSNVDLVPLRVRRGLSLSRPLQTPLSPFTPLLCRTTACGKYGKPFSPGSTKSGTGRGWSRLVKLVKSGKPVLRAEGRSIITGCKARLSWWPPNFRNEGSSLTLRALLQVKVTLDGLLASFSSPPSETLHDDQAMLLRAQEGWVAKHPVVLIPGFVTSGKPIVWILWGASRQAASLEQRV